MLFWRVLFANTLLKGEVGRFFGSYSQIMSEKMQLPFKYLSTEMNNAHSGSRI